MKKKDIDSELVHYLSDLLQETGLSEIEYEKDGARIRVGRQLAAAAAVAAAPVAATPAATAPAASAAAPEPTYSGTMVNSPMVGTVYMSPEPGAAAFVKEGDEVEKGATLLIVEAMKVMNPITAPTSGKISKILVDDAQPVEFGDHLVVIE